jgi:hypothetical protein
MQSLITWIAFGLGALFFIACVVAWWEHLGRDGKAAEEPDWDLQPKVVSVDVELDAAAVEAAPPGDVGERRQALGGAISRMAGADRRSAFGDTIPMILAGAPADSNSAPPVADRRQRDRVKAGG